MQTKAARKYSVYIKSLYLIVVKISKLRLACFSLAYGMSIHYLMTHDKKKRRKKKVRRLVGYEKHLERQKKRKVKEKQEKDSRVKAATSRSYIYTTCIH